MNALQRRPSEIEAVERGVVAATAMIWECERMKPSLIEGTASLGREMGNIAIRSLMLRADFNDRWHLGFLLGTGFRGKQIPEQYHIRKTANSSFASSPD
jgi:hypothetical protein